ncbi:hypothetical protein [Paenibacillus methanolicus]|uniref:Uncharacterized protein n=1 Tax=Paenibacillus methanolicus TaxID=582686 RepID=A0A5S5C5M6_9BACL|nr:hypothetical protein [Paenibacillus methanolicus]TYP73263.1 hypothetical protein BCM02_107247 [Paenibacillus methanolicus]
MSSTTLVCVCVGLYRDALTRGQRYEILEEDSEKAQIKVLGDNNRTRWFPRSYFNDSSVNVPVIDSWKFDDYIRDDGENSLEHIEFTVTFSTGEQRWGWICTKAGLADYIDRNWNGPVLLIENQIVVQNFSHSTVQEALYELDRQDQLIRATQPLKQKVTTSFTSD